MRGVRPMLVLVCAIGAALLASTVLYVLAVLDRRPQRVGLAFAVVAGILYVVYYSDVLLGDDAFARSLLEPLSVFGDVDTQFASTSLIALLMIPVYLLRGAFFLRVSGEVAVWHVPDRNMNFVSGVTAVMLLGGSVVSAFHGGVATALGFAALAGFAYALGAFFRGVDALAAAAFTVASPLGRRCASAIVVRFHRLVTLITALYDAVGQLMVDWTRMLRNMGETQEAKLREQQRRENDLLRSPYVRRRRRDGTRTDGPET